MKKIIFFIFIIFITSSCSTTNDFTYMRKLKQNKSKTCLTPENKRFSRNTQKDINKMCDYNFN